MNEADSEEMLSHLALRGVSLAESLEEADIVLINTCTIREHAEHRAISYLGRLAKWKAEKKNRTVIFAGCAAERMGEAAKKKYPLIDIVSGAKSIDNFSDILDESGLFNNTAEGETKKTGLTGYVTIMRGCNFNCSYCIVPSVRGPVVCFEKEKILEDAKEKIAKGAKEIMLLGQTVNAYPKFDELLLSVAEVEGVERVRFMSPHPAYINKNFMRVFDNPKIAKHIHLPLQSGSTEVLKHMKRGYTREMLEEKLTLLADAKVMVSTDIIVGYPTETEKDFEDTLSLFDNFMFSFAYCFKFSPRAGTPAALLKESPDAKTVAKRLDILLNKVKALSVKAYESMKGREVAVLMETPFKGRTGENLWFKTKTAHKPGETLNTVANDVNKTILLE